MSNYHTASYFKQAKAFMPLDAWIPPSKLPQIDAAVKANCDTLDGVADGIIQNPAKYTWIVQ